MSSGFKISSLLCGGRLDNSSIPSVLRDEVLVVQKAYDSAVRGELERREAAPVGSVKRALT